MFNLKQKYNYGAYKYMTKFCGGKMKIRIWILAMVLSFSLLAQGFDQGKMDEYLNLLESKDKVMGTVSIFKDGKEVYTKSMGYASVENSIKNTSSTKYRIGSITKTYTATVIMKLVEDKKLSLETTIDKFFPEIKNSNKITIEMLLRHRSGIVNLTNVPEYNDYMYTKVSQEEMIKKITALGSSFNPNEKFEYSNSNYILLGVIAEKTTKKGLGQLYTEYIMKPLGIKNEFYGAKIDIKNNEANSYVYANKWTKAGETDMSVPGGAGAGVSVAEGC